MIGAICCLKSNTINASAYETSSATQLGLKQQSDNAEVCGSYARAQSYAFYPNPCLNGMPLTFRDQQLQYRICNRDITFFHRHIRLTRRAMDIRVIRVWWNIQWVMGWIPLFLPH